jgi:hypothetical protein
LIAIGKVPFTEQSPILQNTWPHIMLTALALFSKLAEAYERLFGLLFFVWLCFHMRVQKTT